MKRISSWILLGGMGLGLCLSLGSGCGLARSEAFGGETHWLQSCGSPGSGAAECGPNLDCVCGVCTAPCSDDSSCSNLNDDARCAVRNATPYASSCESRAPERLCVRSADVSTANPAEEVRLRSADAGTPGEDGTEPTSCVQTAKGCLACDDAMQSLASDVREIVQSGEFDVCSSDDDCLVISGWGCGRQCDLPVNGALGDTLISRLEDLTRGYCNNPDEWTETCGEMPVCYLGSLCRAGRCIATTEQACYSRPLDTCELDGDCVLATAFPYDPAGQCFGSSPVPVGCVDPDSSCPPATRAAVDESGTCFLFGNCLPFGFGAPGSFERDEHACSDAIATTCSN